MSYPYKTSCFRWPVVHLQTCLVLYWYFDKQHNQQHFVPWLLAFPTVHSRISVNWCRCDADLLSQKYMLYNICKQFDVLWSLTCLMVISYRHKTWKSNVKNVSYHCVCILSEFIWHRKKALFTKYKCYLESNFRLF